MLRCRGLRTRHGARPIDLDIRRGETLGLAGLEGHGQDLFLETLAGLRPPLDGVVEALGSVEGTSRLRSQRDAVRHGVVYLPRDRKTQGILPGLSVLNNFGIATLPRYATAGVLRKGEMERAYRTYHDRLAIHAESPDVSINSLSGGNQQKVLISRWLAAQPRVVLLNDPTRGVDVATRTTLYGVFREASSMEGISFVILSSQIEELLMTADRVLVFREGSVFRDLARDEISSDNIIAAMFGRETA
ncbi:MAG: ATP-binding cassette domain-containing protein [Thermaerobacter sp.]|nr:ATP-binding cassette domain-containing protein [Thermaerobacter sp.]